MLLLFPATPSKRSPTLHATRGRSSAPLFSSSHTIAPMAPSSPFAPQTLTPHVDEEPKSDTCPAISSLTRNPSPAVPDLLRVDFNQDSSCFSAATSHGFRAYGADPFREIFRRDFFDPAGAGGRGIGIVAMLFRSNIMALVGGGPVPHYPRNKVMIWNDFESRCMGELSFRSDVKAVRLRRDRIVVVLQQKLLVYNFDDLRLLDQIETFANPKGLCEISHVSGPLVLVCLGPQKGQVRVEDYGSRRTKLIPAHDSPIACFALTQDGRLLATASRKGTLIRIFNSLDGALLQEVRRGAHRAEIYSLAFSSAAQWLAVSSDKGTVHVFSLKVESGSLWNDRSHITLERNLSAPSSVSSFSLLRGVLPKYLGSEWSVAQFRLDEGIQYIVAFGRQRNTLLIIGMDRSFYRCEFNPTLGGDMKQLEQYNFL